MIPKNIFRAYDIRGIYPTELNEDVAFKIGQAFGTFTHGRIVIGCDTRLSSPALKENLIKGIISTGSDVIDIGMSSTPMTIFATRYLKCDGGVNVTASHNPKEYNGFKLYDKDAVPISYESGIEDIKKIFESGEFKTGNGTIIVQNIKEDYIKFLFSNLKVQKPLDMSVVVDAGNGVAGLFLSEAFERLGVKVHALYCEPDGNFPNHAPDPSKPENIEDLQKKVKEINADIGFAYDGDGDRLVVVDKNGKVIHVGVIFSLLIKNILAENPKSKVIYTPLDSKAIEDMIKNNDGIPILCRVGHTYITQKLLEEDAALAGEISGHYYFKETFGADDSLFTSLKLIEYLTKSNKTLADYENELPKYFSEVSEANRFPIKESEKFPFIETLKTEFMINGYKVDTLDGVKVFFDDGWVLIRPSNTEAVISLSYESVSKEGFDRLKNFVNDIISRIPGD